MYNQCKRTGGMIIGMNAISTIQEDKLLIQAIQPVHENVGNNMLEHCNEYNQYNRA